MIRAILAAGLIGATRTRGELEIALREFLDGLGFPRPEMNVWLKVGDEWYEVDCLWRKQKVIAGLDSQFHMTPQAFEADRARDRALAASEWLPIRITWQHLQEAVVLERDLRKLLLGGAPAAPGLVLPDAAHQRSPASVLS